MTKPFKNQILLSLTLVLATSAYQAEATHFQGQQSISITSEIEEDCYLAGGKISVEAPIRGDLLCAGGDIVLRDTIEEDLMLAGGTVDLNAYIGDDLRIAAGSITINHTIRGDVLIAGGEITIGKEAQIYGRLLMMGGNLVMNGTVLGRSDIRGGNVIWNGRAENDIKLYAHQLDLNGALKGKTTLVAKTIMLGSKAAISGELNFWTTDENFDFGRVMTNGATATYQESLKTYLVDWDWRYSKRSVLAYWLYRLLTAGLIIGLLVLLFHRFFVHNGQEASTNHGNHIAYGFLYLLGIPLLAGLAFITVIGIPVGMMAITIYGLSLALGHILASLFFAYGINYFYHKNWNRLQLFLSAWAAFTLLKLIVATPWFGWLISIAALIMGLGILFYIWWNQSSTSPSADGEV